MTTPNRAEVLGAIFDVDGVLVDSAECHYRAWSRLGIDLGVPHPREVFERTFGMHNRQIIPIWLGDRAGSEDIEALGARKESYYREEAAGSLEPLPGVIDLIDDLASAGFRLAVGSSAPRANVELVLDVLRLRGRFQALSTGDDVRHGKPHPEVFEKAIARLGTAPRRSVVIEDAPQGIEAGLAAGARVIAVASSRPIPELSRAHLAVESLELLDAERVRRLIESGE